MVFKYAFFEKFPEKIAPLRKLWAEGKTGTEIAIELGTTRNTVIGKVHRLKLPGRPSPIVRNADGPKRIRGKLEIGESWTRQELVLDTIPPLPSLGYLRLVCAPVEVFSQPRTCQFPLWGNERPTHEYCADRAIVGRPYCSAHCAKAYVKPTHPQQVYA